MAQVELHGTVVAEDPEVTLPVQPSPKGGLYLLLDDGKALRLVADSMAAQVPVDFMWRNSRKRFEGFLGHRVAVGGYRSGGTLYGASIQDAAPGASSPDSNE
jgi:hypothetical protein